MLQRELEVASTIQDLYSGRPVIYTMFLGYDEVAHHSGIERPETLRELAKIDRAFARLARAAEDAPRPYRIVVLADHGQSQGATFKQRYGLSLADLVTAKCGADEVLVPGGVDEGWGYLSAAATEGASSSGVTGSVTRLVTRGSTAKDGTVELGAARDESGRKQRHREKKGAEGPPEVTVMASGCLGLISFPQIEGRATLEQLDDRYPDQSVTNPSMVGVAPVGGAFHGSTTSSPSLKRFCSSRMLNNWVFVWNHSSPESGFGASMSVATVYGTTSRSAPCSAQPGIGLLSSFPDHALERLAISRPVEMTKHVVERPVLEQNDDDVVQRACGGARIRHGALLRSVDASHAPSTGPAWRVPAESCKRRRDALACTDSCPDRRPRSRSDTVALMAEVVETSDLTASSQDGWAVDYRIRRDDGEELHAEVRCWQKAHAAADRAANAEALAAIADRGHAAALEYSELVESPATRGAVVISIWFDPVDDGALRRRVSYERGLE